ncbi:hypothetical protein GCM10022237_41350 [Nocardioides ginsengisoli]
MIVGVATVTMVRSTRIMKKPITNAHRAGQGLADSAGVVAASGMGALLVMDSSQHLTTDTNPRAPAPAPAPGRRGVRVTMSS